MTAAKSFVNTVHPISLKEARLQATRFDQCRPIWHFVQYVIIGTTLGVIFIGGEVIHLLTHGKFVDSAAFLVFLLTATLMQNGALAPRAMFLANGRAQNIAWIMVVATGAAAVVVLALTEHYGVWAVIGALMIRHTISWILLHWYAHSSWQMTFIDWPVLVGQGVIFSAFGLVQWLEPDLSIRLALSGLVVAIILILLIRTLKLAKSLKSSVEPAD